METAANGWDTPVARMLGVRYPVILGAMRQITLGEMAAAVSAAGGFGQVAADRRISSMQVMGKRVPVASTIILSPGIWNFSRKKSFFSLRASPMELLCTMQILSGLMPFIPDIIRARASSWIRVSCALWENHRSLFLTSAVSSYSSKEW